MYFNGHSLPKIGVSACLLGHEVRYDGGHKRNRFLTEILSEHMEYLPLCPETAIGLGVPRPPIRLMGDYDHPRATGVDDPSLDVTETLERYAESQVTTLGHLSGCVLKADSPSCGMERVKVYAPSGNSAIKKGSGVFARLLMEKLPLLPVEDEGRLSDVVLRENFINRVYTYQRWQTLMDAGLSTDSLKDFHTRHKYMVMAHSQAAYHRLGRRLSGRSDDTLKTTAEAYIAELITSLKRSVNRERHVNVLQHIMGYLKKRIDGADNVKLTDSIEAYRRGKTPLVVPITLLRHYFHRHRDPYMHRQHYLNPYPEKLGLRNSI